MLSPTRLSLPMARLSRHIRLTINFLTPRHNLQFCPHVPLHHICNGCILSHIYGLGYSDFARRYLRNHFVFFSSDYLDVSVRPLTPAYLSIQHAVTSYYRCRVPPFGHRRIYACFQLPDAFRRLPRPSSALCPKASTIRPL